jgi:hypothetical protein
MHARPSDCWILKLRRRLAVMRPGRATAFACALAVAVAVGVDDFGPASGPRAASHTQHADGARVAGDTLTRAARSEPRADSEAPFRESRPLGESP